MYKYKVLFICQTNRRLFLNSEKCDSAIPRFVTKKKKLFQLSFYNFDQRDQKGFSVAFSKVSSKV